MKGFPARFGFAVVEADREMRAAAFGANVAGMQIGIVRKTVGDDRPADVGEQFAHDRIVDAHHGKRSEEHTSELQSLMRISYAVFCLKKKTKTKHHINTKTHNQT